MKKFFKILIVTQLLVVLIVTIYIVVAGQRKVCDAFIGEYVVSENGGEITVYVGVSGSLGAVRKIVPQTEHGILYLDCYAAPYAIIGYVGATNEESFLLEEDTKTIVLYRRPGIYEVILKKDENGNWERIKLGTFIERK